MNMMCTCSSAPRIRLWCRVELVVGDTCAYISVLHRESKCLFVHLTTPIGHTSWPALPYRLCLLKVSKSGTYVLVNKRCCLVVIRLVWIILADVTKSSIAPFPPFPISMLKRLYSMSSCSTADDVLVIQLEWAIIVLAVVSTAFLRRCMSRRYQLNLFRPVEMIGLEMKKLVNCNQCGEAT